MFFFSKQQDRDWKQIGFWFKQDETKLKDTKYMFKDK